MPTTVKSDSVVLDHRQHIIIDSTQRPNSSPTAKKAVRRSRFSTGMPKKTYYHLDCKTDPSYSDHTLEIYSFAHSFNHSFIHSFLYLFISLFILSFILSFIHSFIYSFLHSLFTIYIQLMCLFLGLFIKYLFAYELFTFSSLHTLFISLPFLFTFSFVPQLLTNSFSAHLTHRLY